MPGYERRWIYELMEEVAGSAIAPKAVDVAERVHLKLIELDGLGEMRARLALDEIARQSLSHMASSWLKNRGAVTVGWNGKPIAVIPERLSEHPPTVTGQREKAGQYPLWIYLPWDRVRSIRNDYATRSATLAGKVVAFDRILSLEERFPDAKTPAEALEMAGLDAKQIDL